MPNRTMAMTNKPVRGGALPPLRGADTALRTLLSAGEATGRVSPAAARRVRVGLDGMLTRLAVTYTFGASSSMPADTARRLLDSAVYAIGLALKQTAPDAALDRLFAEPADTLRREGLGVIDALLRRSRERLAALQAAPVTTSRAYLDTLDHGLPLFFASYDSVYGAHETPGSIDYPPCVDIGRLTGAEFIDAYTGALTAEAAFLSRWTPAEVDALLRGYSVGWRDLLENAYGRALTNALGRALCGRDLSHPGLSPDAVAALAGRLAGLSAPRLRAALGVALQRLGLDDAGLAYARRALPDIAASIASALRVGHAETAFISPVFPISVDGSDNT